MKICRFNDNRIGVVQGDIVRDVSVALTLLPNLVWPVPLGDLLIEHLPGLLPTIQRLAQSAPSLPLSEVVLNSPVANPSKIINAPINYQKHIAETKADQDISHGRDMTKTISDWGLFLKANSSLIGAGDEVVLRYPERRIDHEIELAVIIGKKCHQIARDDALGVVAGYAIGLDITVRGPELQSFRKSADTFAVCGPWIVTADELDDPSDLDFELQVNGELRQSANTAQLIYDVPKLIEYASSMYTLYAGDIIFTGTPEGVGPLQPGDIMDCSFDRIGSMQVQVASSYV